MGAARNLGVALARGRWVLLLEVHSRPGPETLRLHLERQQSCSTPTAVLGRYDLPRDLCSTSFQRLQAHPARALAGSGSGPKDQRPGPALGSANISLPRSAFLACYGFDESLPFATTQALELGYRLQKRLGLQLLLDDSILCHHDRPSHLWQLLTQQYLLGWSTAQVAARHRDPSLVAGHEARSLDLTFWHSLRDRLRQEEPEAQALLHQLLQAEEREREGSPAGGDADTLEHQVRQLGAHAFSRGLQVAEAGFDPADYRGGSAFIRPTESSS